MSIHWAAATCSVIYQLINLRSTRIDISQASRANPFRLNPWSSTYSLVLLQNRDRVVTRAELLDSLWKGKVVTDAAVAVRLKGAHKVIQDSGAKQNSIRANR